jgi:hypothetical protein
MDNTKGSSVIHSGQIPWQESGRIVLQVTHARGNVRVSYLSGIFYSSPPRVRPASGQTETVGDARAALPDAAMGSLSHAGVRVDAGTLFWRGGVLLQGVMRLLASSPPRARPAPPPGATCWRVFSSRPASAAMSGSSYHGPRPLVPRPQALRMCRTAQGLCKPRYSV